MVILLKLFPRSQFNTTFGMCLSAILLLSFARSAESQDGLRWSIQPKGTNQVEIIFGPVIPDCYYEVRARTNGLEGHWLNFGGGFIGGSNKTITATCNLGGADDLQGLTMKSLNHWGLVAGHGEDSDGDGLSDSYEDLVTRTDPYSGDDGYSDPDGDGWANLQELTNNTDPLRANRPAGPRSDIKFYSDTNSARLGKAILTIENTSDVLPDYYVIERASRTMRPPTVDPRYNRPMPSSPYSGPRTNRPPYPQPPPRRPPFGQREDPWVTGEFKFAGRVATKPGVKQYTYVETNVDTFMQPAYRISAHFVPPSRAFLDRVDAVGIRQTILAVNARPMTNGYDLTATRPIPYGRYLLLVRDQNNAQWQASGYFSAGTNRGPVSLQVNSKGMMTSGQSPIAMPEVKFLPDVVEPEFTAGWGEDCDGDGLPDIYEVLVTGTDPIKADTGPAGILDGYKEPAKDGWSNLEKFRRRADPAKPVSLPAPIVLKQPTAAEAMQTTSLRTDLRYEPQIQIKILGTDNFQPIRQSLLQFYQISNPRNAWHTRGNFDLRISWAIPERRPHVSGGGP